MRKRLLQFCVCFFGLFAVHSVASAQSDFTVGSGLGFGGGTVANTTSGNISGGAGFSVGVHARTDLTTVFGAPLGLFAHANLTFATTTSLGGSGGGSSGSATFFGIGLVPTIGFDYRLFGFETRSYLGVGLGLFASRFGFELLFGADFTLSETLGIFSHVILHLPGGVGLNFAYLLGVSYKL